jgi:hypothetical protein
MLKASFSTASTARRSSMVEPAGSENPEMLRAARMRVDLTYLVKSARSSSVKTRLSKLRSEE